MTPNDCCPHHSPQTQPAAKERTGGRLWDNLGIGLSGLCLLHCLGTPFLLPLLPLLGHQSHDDHLHLFLFFPLLFIAAVAFWHGYRHHRQLMSLYIFVSGSLLLLLSLAFSSTLDGQWAWSLSVFASIVGSLLLIVAHYKNRKACRTALKN